MTSKVPAFFACEWEPADAAALQALQRGDASPEQQKRALDWFITHAAGTYNVSFIPGTPEATAFMEGRRYAGLKVITLLKVIPSAFTKDRNNA